MRDLFTINIYCLRKKERFVKFSTFVIWQVCTDSYVIRTSHLSGFKQRITLLLVCVKKVLGVYSYSVIFYVFNLS